MATRAQRCPSSSFSPLREARRWAARWPRGQRRLRKLGAERAEAETFEGGEGGQQGDGRRARASATFSRAACRPYMASSAGAARTGAAAPQPALTDEPVGPPMHAQEGEPRRRCAPTAHQRRPHRSRRATRVAQQLVEKKPIGGAEAGAAAQAERARSRRVIAISNHELNTDAPSTRRARRNRTAKPLDRIPAAGYGIFHGKRRPTRSR